jgi:hypothetical protein
MQFDEQLIGGIPVRLYGLRNLPHEGEAGLCFFMHGRMGSIASSHGLISRFYQRAQAASRLPLLVVAFDHRNHGTRLMDRGRNLAWKEHSSTADDLANPSHAVDMYSVQCGHYKPPEAQRLIVKISGLS